MLSFQSHFSQGSLSHFAWDGTTLILGWSLFGASPIGAGRPEIASVTTSFRDWKHATGKNNILNCHKSCAAHKQAVVDWSQYTLNVQQGVAISEQLVVLKLQT